MAHTKETIRKKARLNKLTAKAIEVGPESEESVLRPLGRQDNEDLDRLIVAADTGLLRLTCLLFDSEWFWDSLLDSWTDYLMSPFEDYPLDDAQ